MSFEVRVYNESRCRSMRRKQALRGIENCALAWVKEGVSVRDLSLAESIAARAKQAKKKEPLAAAELRHVYFEPPPQALPHLLEHRVLRAEANQLFRGNWQLLSDARLQEGSV